MLGPSMAPSAFQSVVTTCRTRARIGLIDRPGYLNSSGMMRAGATVPTLIFAILDAGTTHGAVLVVSGYGSRCARAQTTLFRFHLLAR